MKEPRQSQSEEISPEEKSRRLKRRIRALQGVARIAGAVGTVMFAVTTVTGVYTIQISAAVMIGASALLNAIAGTLQAQNTASSIEEIEAQIESKEAPPKPEETVFDLLRRHIQIAVDREGISMLLAEQRANTLYGFGQLFLISSIVAPIVAGVVYWTIDPLPAETVAQIKELKESLGELPKSVSFAVQRDWRILLGGVSFGFLLLAAAAGLLRQQRKEIAIYFRLSERINYFERLESVLQIRSKLSDSRADSASEMTELVIEKLLNGQSSDSQEAEEDDNEPDPKAAIELVKAIRGISG